MKNLMWTFALMASLVFLAFAYYMRSETVRTAIDAKLPWVAEHLGPYVKKSEDAERPATRAGNTPESSPNTAASVASVPPSPVESDVFDLQKLAANRSAWPTKVKLAKPTNFPAVVGGKVVGSLVAPAGTEVALVKISDGKLGVEYQGGGAWLGIDETDVVARTGKRRN